MKAIQNNSKQGVVGYERTSSEGHDTSIDSQKETIEKFIERNGWEFIRHYTDEALSGAKVEGRDDFQRMIKDAAKGQFDFIVVYDIDRFARDGSDIISNAKFLKDQFGVHVIDTKGFDTRKPRNVLMNFVKAGVAEDERLKILERTTNGRIETAKQSKPWTGKMPAGRGFDKETGKWFVTGEGEKLKKILTEYANGKPLKSLTDHPATITRIVRESQLSGTYYAKFNSPEIGINESIPVPQIPEVITPELERRVKDRMAHNKIWNKNNKKKYHLSGFASCWHCGKPLRPQTMKGVVYYRHYAKDKSGCPYRGIPGDVLEKHALDYLYSFFLDRPAYDKAIKEALPDEDDRKALQKDIKQVDKQLARTAGQLSNLAKALADGADFKELLDKQDELKNEGQALESRRDELIETLGSMPDYKCIEREATALRILLIDRHRNKDWRTIPFNDVQKFLHFLFSDNPRRTGYGISVGKIKGNWQIKFKGCVDFFHKVIDGRAVGKRGDEILGYIEREDAIAEREYRKELKELKRNKEKLSTPTVCSTKVIT